MFTAYVVVAALAAAANIYIAINDFIRTDWIVANMTKVGVPRSWLFPLGALKAPTRMRCRTRTRGRCCCWPWARWCRDSPRGERVFQPAEASATGTLVRV
jgi:hypothetical protein